MSRNYIITNFAYGTGPYLRTTDLALAVNDELEKAGKERMGIIVPWVYREKQKRIMGEEFADHNKKYPSEMLLDATLGELLRSIFYADCTYKQALEAWVKHYREISLRAYQHLSFDIETETFNGEKKIINGTKIAIELNRSPRIRFNVAPAYCTTFANVADILEQAIHVQEIALDRDLLTQGIKAAEWVERNQKMRFMAWPATFAFLPNIKPRYDDELFVPPIAPLPPQNHENIDPGIFVTVTGISGLERLYADAKRLGIQLYSNDTDAVLKSVYLSPHAISNKNIILQFARAGWSSIWISMITGTPLVVPDFDSQDDPEIYFNNRSVENLGLGIVYRGQPLEDILKEVPRLKAIYQKINQHIIDRWGTLDGNTYCAKMIVKDFLNRPTV